MKKTGIALITGTIIAVTSASGLILNSKREKEILAALPQGFTITAHTGCEETADNSLESISAGAAAGAQIVEIDLHYLADGTAVLCHDAPKAESAGTLPTLDSAFELLATLDVKMNVDVKSTKNIAAVSELADKHGVREKIFFTGVEEKDVEAVKAGAPGIPYFLNVSVDKKKNTDLDYLISLTDKVRDCGAIGINMNFKGACSQLVSVFRSEGLLVSLWTANKKSEMKKCLRFAPDNITTRKPSQLISVVSSQ